MTIPSSADSPRIVGGRVVAVFAFDVANSIDLEAIPSVLRPGRTRLEARKPAPEYVRFAVAPAEVALGERSFDLGGVPLPAVLTARVFDFGAVSIAWTLRPPDHFSELPQLAERLAHADGEGQSRRVLDELLVEIGPALRGSAANELVEDYYVFQVDGLDPPHDAEALLRDHAATLAAIVTMEAGPLSKQQIDESLRDCISFSPTDLVVADWSAAFVHDPDCADTLLVLDYLNVQLVELLLLDTQLGAALARFSGEIHRGPGLLRAVRGPHRAAIRELSESTLEAQRLVERVENAVKLAPDIYLARVYRRTASRLGLATWERLVQGKLEAMRDLTSVLVERAAAQRAEALEIAIILLIVLEIVLALARMIP
jgi:hypothetical protein